MEVAASSCTGGADAAFIQRRLATVGKVMLVIFGTGCVLNLAFNGIGRALKPVYWMFVASAGCWAVLWLSCRGPTRSPRALRVIEASCFLAAIAFVAAMFRFNVIDSVPAIAEWAGDDPRLVATMAVGLESNLLLGNLIAMSFALIVRAALVPTSPRYTLALTLGAGATQFAFSFIDVPGLRLPVDRAAAAVDPGAIDLGFWWVAATIICYTVSRIVHGLRAEVREARKLGRYTLEQKLGEGGMGVVYVARHAMLRRPTAIKLLPLEKAGARSLARFEREVQLTSELSHPNTITIYDYGRTPDGVFYYAMELLDGATLGEIVGASGAMPPARVIQILHQIAGALDEAHSVGLIHRDIKPANIMLVEQGGVLDVAKILDFGLVKELDRSDDSVTHADTITGTPHYMAPESITSPDAVDARGDIYALGAVGYFVLTGEHVFTGATVVEICSAHLHAAPVPPSERLGEPVPADLERLVLDCLAKDAEDRPQSARALRQRLDDLDACGTWTEEDARAWWRDYREAVATSVEPREAAASDATIEADLRGRSTERSESAV